MVAVQSFMEWNPIKNRKEEVIKKRVDIGAILAPCDTNNDIFKVTLLMLFTLSQLLSTDSFLIKALLWYSATVVSEIL